MMIECARHGERHGERVERVNGKKYTLRSRVFSFSHRAARMSEGMHVKCTWNAFHRKMRRETELIHASFIARARIRPRVRVAMVVHASSRTLAFVVARSSFARARIRPDARARALRVAFVSWDWPERDASAAGVRTMAIADALRARGHDVVVLACANADLVGRGKVIGEGYVATRVEANRGRATRAAFEDVNPDVVVFDRFIAEEAFGAIVRQEFPRCVRVLDMQDAHCVRRARQSAKAGAGACATPPRANDVDTMRELAAVWRSDLALVCSRIEMTWLTNACGVAKAKVREASFFYDGVEAPKAESVRGDFDRRSGFATIGTFKHAPNVDSVEWLASEVWPLVRARLPDATMDVYGSYPNAKVERFHAPERGFRIRGRAESLKDTLSAPRVLLAPLRFGAGIKGKVLDAWTHGLPVVTTPIGSEATVPGEVEFWTPASAPVTPSAGWGGFGDCVTAQELADAAVRVHEDYETWREAQANGAKIMNELFSHDVNMPPLIEAIESAAANIDEIRANDYVGQSLWYHTERSTLYFSKWIELKETGANT